MRWDLGGGRFESDFSTSVVRVNGVDGWGAVDLGLAARDGGWEPARSGTAVRFSGGGDRVAVSMGDHHYARREHVVAIRPSDGLPYDHITEVRNAMGGLTNRLEAIKRNLGYPGLHDEARSSLQQELSEGSRLLDHAKEWLSG